MYHTMKGGTKILIKDMGDNHLINTLRLIERKAEEGFAVCRGSSDIEETWYDEDHLSGEGALAYLNYSEYVDEARKRDILL